MHHVKKALATLLVMTFVLAMIPIMVFAQEEVLLYGRQLLASMPNGKALVAAYDKMDECVATAQGTVNLYDAAAPINKDELDAIFNMLYADRPEYFWLNTGYGYSNYTTGEVVIFRPNYNELEENRQEYKAKLQQVLDRMLVGTAGMSDYEISLLLHDRLGLHTEYMQTGYHQTAYGALVDGMAVCAGYTKAYQLLLREAGIPCFYVKGTSFVPSTGAPIGHAWNLVELDGQWYYTDATWDDQGDTLAEIYHAYLNVTYDQMAEDHIPAAGIYENRMPHTTATAANYFIRNGGVITTYSTSQIAARIRVGNNMAELYLSDRDRTTFWEWVKENRVTIANEAGITGGFLYGYRSLGPAIYLYMKDSSVTDLSGKISLPKTAHKGEKLQVSHTLPGDARLYWRWYRDGLPLTNWNEPFYYVSDADVGHTLSVRVTAENYKKELTSSTCRIETVQVSGVRGDANNNGKLSGQDASYLLYHTLMPEEYPVYQAADYDGSGVVDSDDAIYLLYHTMLPGKYPLAG